MVSFIKPNTVPLLLVGLVALLAHGLSLRADFYMDDRPHILDNDQVQDAVELPSSFASRQLTYGLWRAIHLTVGDQSWAFHAVNLLFHILTAALFLLVARSMMALSPVKSLTEADRSRIAFWGAMIFACHPLCSEPINYTAQTSILMASFFGMLATFLYLRWHETRRSYFLTLIPLVVLLAAHSKEPGLFHVGINLFFLGALTFSPKLLVALKENRRLRIAAIGGIGMIAIILAGSWMAKAISHIADGERFTSYALSQSRVLVAYLSRVILPFNLSSDHFIPWSVSFRDVPASIALVLAIASGISLFICAAWKRSWWATLLALALFHLFIRYAYTVDELMVEYRTYPAMPWFGLLLACGIHQLTKLSPTNQPWLRPFAFASVVAVFTTLSALRSHVWSDEYRLAQNVLRRYPENLRALNILMSQQFERGEFQKLADMRSLPDSIARSLGEKSAKSATRKYTAGKSYVNYITCQFFVLQGLIKVGEVNEAQRRADILLVDVLKRLPEQNHPSIFTITLAKLLCHQARGDFEGIEQTFKMISGHYTDEASLRYHLADTSSALALNDAVLED